jgi:hypothetical protein
MTFVSATFFGVAVFVLLFTIYAHVEGNRVTATRRAFHDIRRDMRQHPVHKVWWRAFRMAMGWKRRDRHRNLRRNNVTVISAAQFRKRA